MMAVYSSGDSLDRSSSPVIGFSGHSLGLGPKNDVIKLCALCLPVGIQPEAVKLPGR